MPLPEPPTLVAARNAMATRFELVLYGKNRAQLQAAAEEAFDEIDRCEAQLSLFRPDSEIALLNRRAAFEPVRVSETLYHLLEEIGAWHERTGGLFDPSVGPLMRAWGLTQSEALPGTAPGLEEARACVGMHHMLLDAVNRTVRYDRPGVVLDLGSIGKGYAVDRALILLREAGIERALLHGGTSTIAALSAPPGCAGWDIGLELPPLDQISSAQILGRVALCDETLSVSGIWGRRTIATDGTGIGHVIDPRTGAPVTSALMAAVISPSALSGDALSTGLLVGGLKALDRLAAGNSGFGGLVVTGSDPLVYECRDFNLQAVHR